MNTKKNAAPAPYVKGRIAPSQIKAIHATVGKLGLDDEAYRDILKSRFGVDSCKGLSWRPAEELLGSLNGKPPSQLPPAGGRSSVPSPSGGGLGRGKYTDMDGRPGFASGAQLRLIDAMWNQVTRAEDAEAAEKALNSFVNRIAHVAGIRMLKSWQIEKIVRALEAMGAEKKEATS